MRKKILLPALCGSLLLAPTLSFGQQAFGGGQPLSHPGSMSGPPVTARDASPYQNIVNINGTDGYYLKKDMYLIDYYTIIDGQRVVGLPYLFADWLNGTLTTPDGRIYTDYKYKYNVQNQSITFLNGTDSMETNEEIKEFTLKIPRADSMITARFIRANQLKDGKPFYYEVLLDSDKGQLLKTNTKVIGTLDNGILATQTKRCLKLESEYYYFDKTKNKLTKIKPSTDLKSLLHLTDEQAAGLHTETFDTTDEQNLLTFFKNYFQKKGF